MGLKPAADLSNVTAVVLAGGFGTRLRSVVADRPKVMAQVNGRPFLTYILDQLAATECRSVVLCTGYLGEQIRSAFGGKYQSLRLRYSWEPEPLGTGGALKLALSQIASDPVLVLNGDSFYGIDLMEYGRWHGDHDAVASIALTRMRHSERYGRVKMDAAARVVNFCEKEQASGPGWINAGIYMLGRKLLETIPDGKNVSLERELFPDWTRCGVYGYYNPGCFLDIGTPEDFGSAEEFFCHDRTIKQRPAIVLDRDGTIIQEYEYLSDPEQVELIPGAGAALRELQQIGFSLVMITNQSGIARGFFSDAVLQQIHHRLNQLLAEAGVRLDGIYVCPHKPEDACSCRKPKIGLMEQAATELGFTPEHSIVIGDKTSDIEMGRNSGAVTFLVRTGYGASVEANENITADYVVDDLRVAASIIAEWSPVERSFDHDHQ